MDFIVTINPHLQPSRQRCEYIAHLGDKHRAIRAAIEYAWGLIEDEEEDTVDVEEVEVISNEGTERLSKADIRFFKAWVFLATEILVKSNFSLDVSTCKRIARNANFKGIVAYTYLFEVIIDDKPQIIEVRF